MAINNVNPRRTIWFSPNEPSNKYDIWLSKNRHYNENGELTTDSNAQRDCDYIFKIYDCGKWNPIVGFNSTAANKINIVKGTQFSCTTPNGYSYTTPQGGYEKFHIPLFRELTDSPTELFDAGTLGEAILKYVTEPEWANTFNSNWFKDAFNSYVIEGKDYNWSNAVINGVGASSQNNGFLNWDGNSFTFLNITSGGEIEMVEELFGCAGGILIKGVPSIGLHLHSPGIEGYAGLELDLEYNKFYTIYTTGRNGTGSLENLKGIEFKDMPKDSRPIYLHIMPYVFEQFKTDCLFIDSNNALLDYTDGDGTINNCLIGRIEGNTYMSYLIEIRFGIIKIEKVSPQTDAN